MVAEEPIEIMKSEEIEKEEVETHNEKINEQDNQDIEEQKPSQSAEVKPEDVKDDSETDVEKKEDDPSKNTPGDPDEDVTMTFPQRLLEILSNHEEHGDIISWLPHGRGFMIYKKKMFEIKIMPKYFHKHSKYTSFTRKLNRWGFVRVTRGPEMGAYYHKFFKRGEGRLCMQMSCQRPTGMGIGDGFPGGDAPNAMFPQQMAMQQNGGFNIAGGQNYLQMQQQHMQLLMRHREQMIQREALLNRSMGGQGPQQNMSAMQMGQMGMHQMGGMKQAAPSGAPSMAPGQGMGMPGMMAMQQNRGMTSGQYPANTM
jgi:hypothetical protein